MEFDEVSTETIVKELLNRIGDNPNREGLKETPQRIARMYKEIFRGYDESQMPKITTFNNGSDGIVYDQMISDIGEFHSICEHHMMPFFGKYYFGYIPHPKGKLIGLSKVARTLEYYAAKLQVQERLVQQVVEELWNTLSNCEYPPIGMGLILDATHLCKTMRGVKNKGKMRTTALKGIFLEDAGVKSEFISMIK